MLPVALALLLLPRTISAAPTANGNEAPPTAPPPRHYSSSSYWRCSNWNPFQCRVIEIITHTVIQHYTSTVYVAVETGDIYPTFTTPYDIAETETRAVNTNTPYEQLIAYTACQSVIKGPYTHEMPLGVSTSTLPEMTTVSYQGPDCANCIYSIQHGSQNSLDEAWAAHPHQREQPTTIVSVWGKQQSGHGDKAKPTGRVSIWEGAGMLAEPSVSITEPHYEHKHPGEDLKDPSWNSRTQCLKRSQYTYTATVGYHFSCDYCIMNVQLTDIVR